MGMQNRKAKIIMKKKSKVRCFTLSYVKITIKGIEISVVLVQRSMEQNGVQK